MFFFIDLPWSLDGFDALNEATLQMNGQRWASTVLATTVHPLKRSSAPFLELELRFGSIPRINMFVLGSQIARESFKHHLAFLLLQPFKSNVRQTGNLVLCSRRTNL